jgi:hypothetical protein
MTFTEMQANISDMQRDLFALLAEAQRSDKLNKSEFCGEIAKALDYVMHAGMALWIADRVNPDILPAAVEIIEGDGDDARKDWMGKYPSVMDPTT